MKTSDYDLTLQWAQEMYGEPNFVQFWFPRRHFIEAERSADGLALSRNDRDKKYGMAVGKGAKPLEGWNHFSYSQSADQSLIDLSRFVHDGSWIAYVISTESFKDFPPLDVLGSEDNWPEIDSFLKSHFADASVQAGNPEVRAWTVMRDDQENIIAAGALSIWESGQLAANSIAVDSSMRGKGIGKEFVRRMISNAYHLGYSSLCLGVFYKNIAGIKLYESVGFTKVDEFFHYSEIDDTEKRRNRPVSD